ncbi:MAG: Permease of the drug/metabolite transporter (DMT) superfamily [uncultured Solirubrobacteraceae bacterium]|uniref:Permease of the drug/metabolite transporter (DMT) superfamily n=1 Tax=uncultured Solirubrobacteraceae bacterium TaxID=1162706 RepID=A0A6J4T573_9ACTN|nr:MAG: Permease of the drug/metabolite transporter (DMT) superfamily [uncultured Solirubrobacteraceae bacterium]
MVVDPRVGPVAVPERRGEEPALLPVDRDQVERADVEVLDQAERVVEPLHRLGSAVGADVRGRGLGDPQRQAHPLRLGEDLARALLVLVARLLRRAAEAAAVLPVRDAERVDVVAAGVEGGDRLGVLRQRRVADRLGQRARARREDARVGAAPERAGGVPDVVDVPDAVRAELVDDVAVGGLVGLGRAVLAAEQVELVADAQVHDSREGLDGLRQLRDAVVVGTGRDGGRVGRARGRDRAEADAEVDREPAVRADRVGDAVELGLEVVLVEPEVPHGPRGLGAGGALDRVGLVDAGLADDDERLAGGDVAHGRGLRGRCGQAQREQGGDDQATHHRLERTRGPNLAPTRQAVVKRTPQIVASTSAPSTWNAAMPSRSPCSRRASPPSSAIVRAFASAPRTEAQRRASASGSVAVIVTPVTRPGPVSDGAAAAHAGPPQRQDCGGSVWSRATIAPGTSAGCRWTSVTSSSSRSQTTRTPSRASRSRAGAMSSTCNMTRQPPLSAPGRSRCRPADVSGWTGETTSTNVSPSAMTALRSPKCPTPSSWKGSASGSAARRSATAESRSRATRTACRSLSMSDEGYAVP